MTVDVSSDGSFSVNVVYCAVKVRRRLLQRRGGAARCTSY